MTAQRKGEIRPNPAEMHVIHCPNCSRVIAESRLQPGTLNRYRCKRCGEWTWLVVPTVDAETVSG